jgi:TPR repeat protein
MRKALAFLPLILTMLIGGQPALAATTFGDALAAYFLQDYDTAFQDWQGLAATGDTASKFYLGLLYETGHGPAQDVEKAIDWYSQAAAAGHAEAAWRLARLAPLAGALPVDAKTMLAWVRQAAQGGIADAQYELGAYLAEGRLVPRDLTAARDWFAAAARSFTDPGKQQQAARMRDLVEARLDR